MRLNRFEQHKLDELSGLQLDRLARDERTTAERKWAAPKLAAKPQQPCDHGMFGDEKKTSWTCVRCLPIQRIRRDVASTRPSQVCEPAQRLGRHGRQPVPAASLHRQAALPRVGAMGQHIVNQQVGDHAATDSVGARLSAPVCCCLI